MKLSTYLILLFLSVSTTAFVQCFNESFDNMGPYSGYATETWTGDDGYTLTATDARTDQTINGDAICVRNGSLSVSGVTGGIGNLTITTERAFSGGTGTLDIHVNGSSVGTVPYDGTIQTTTITGINITGTINVEIFTPSNGDRVKIDDLTWTCFSSSNTIITGTVAPLSYTVDCTTGQSGTVDFTSTGTFNGGNIFTAELSDASGSFASPTSVGTLNLSGVDPSGTINFTIPSGTVAGTGYRIRVVSDDPITIGTDNGSDISITLTGGPCGPFSCFDESFTNSGASGTYSTETWTGDDGYTFTATDSRSDQTINGDAILVRNGSLSVSGVVGGIGDLTLTTQREFAGGTGVLDVHVNGASVGMIPYDGSVQTTTITGINITGAVDVEIFTPSNGDRIKMDDLQWTCFSSSNTITTGTVSPLSYTVDCSTGQSGTVDFTSTGTFNGGNIFTAQLSDASGSFASPVSIGTLTLSGTDPTGTINFTIPAGTVSGTGYRIRVVSDDPFVPGSDNGVDITITLTGGPCVLEPPHITSLIINSCNSTCGEGDNEVIFGNSGDYSIDMNSSNLEVTYGSSPSPTATYTDPLVSNSATTADLDTEAGCPGLFVDATGTTVPPNSTFMVVNNAFCPGDVLDFSNFCGSGPIYVVYSTDGTWNSAGNFSNSTTAGSRYLQSTITTTDGSTHTIDYEFDTGLNTGSDGDYAKWNSAGGLAIEQGNNGCALDPVVLPVELVSLNLNENMLDGIDIEWETLSELNNDQFMIYHSSNGIDFEFITSVAGQGTTSNRSIYSTSHRKPVDGINYYLLRSVDFDGTVYYKGIAAIEINKNEPYYNRHTETIHFPTKDIYQIFTVDGRITGKAIQTDQLKYQGAGIVIVQNISTGDSYKISID